MFDMEPSMCVVDCWLLLMLLLLLLLLLHCCCCCVWGYSCKTPADSLANSVAASSDFFVEFRIKGLNHTAIH
jgi:hypothetical protein